MSNGWKDETAEQTTARRCLAACLNADLEFGGVRDGLCYFHVYDTATLYEGPKVTLSLPADGLTAEKICQHVAEWDERRRSRKKRGSK
jgi:hypothetical protein